jgi:hypothetical protein
VCFENLVGSETGSLANANYILSIQAQIIIALNEVFFILTLLESLAEGTTSAAFSALSA